MLGAAPRELTLAWPSRGHMTRHPEGALCGCTDASAQQHCVPKSDARPHIFASRITAQASNTSVGPRSRRAYDGGREDVSSKVISFGAFPIRVQSLPEQKKRPSAQASTRSVLIPFIVMVE
jgi:hypothetical protein